MTRPTIVAALATAGLALAPALAAAGTGQAAFHGCVQAFMQHLSDKYESAPKLKEARLIDPGYRLPTGSPDSYELTMTATDPRTSRTVERAICTVTPAGEVVALRPEALDAL